MAVAGRMPNDGAGSEAAAAHSFRAIPPLSSQMAANLQGDLAARVCAMAAHLLDISLNAGCLALLQGGENFFTMMPRIFNEDRAADISSEHHAAQVNAGRRALKCFRIENRLPGRGVALHADARQEFGIG